jgi:hypothetical protein
MADFFLYLKTFTLTFWLAIPAGALFGFDELARRYFPSIAGSLDMVQAGTRRRIEIIILVGVVFYSGFTAWNQEHDLRLAAVTERDEVRGRLIEQSSNKIDMQSQVAVLSEQLKQFTDAKNKQRHLTEEQKEKLRNAVCKIPGKYANLFVRSERSPESLRYADEIIDVLRKCNVEMAKFLHSPWAIDISDEGMKGIYLSIKIKDAPEESSKAYFSLLHDIGLPVEYLDWDVVRDEPEIIIGHK